MTDFEPANPDRFADEFLTVRDLLRHAVSRFTRAGIAYGHGAGNALEEGIFLILEALRLPVEDVNPWADARLTPDERLRILGLIEQRVMLRKPAAYLLNAAYMHGERFYVDERVLVPRSFIGELLHSELIGGEDMALIPDPEEVSAVLDLCAGSGCLAILAARVFPGAAIDAADISTDALAVAAINLADKHLQDRIALRHSDLFAGLKGRRYDLIISNPPYVTEEEMTELPPEYAAEPELGLVAGEDGLDIVRRILADAPAHLNPGGGLMVEIGTAREALEAAFPEVPFVWLDTAESQSEVFWVTREDLV